MKHLLTAAALLLSIAAFAQAGTSPAQFDVLKYSFGKIKQGKPVTTNFTFTNNGDRPLIIETAEAGCGCTTPEYPKQPIMHGKTGVIKVTYNAEATGKFTKNVNVKFAGIDLPVQLLIEGEVEPAKP